MLLRLALTLLLCTASAAAMAARAGGDCVGTDADACALGDPAPTELGGAASAHGKAALVRNKYASQAVATPSGATSRGGGSDEVPVLRPRPMKWHSFLPGMFR